MTVFIVGLPGAGKTTLGRRLAAALGFPFDDLDAAIERRSGRTVSDIFAGEGEAAFRALETEALLSFSPSDARVVATGGGAVLRGENVRHMRRGFVLWLDRPAAEIARDLVRDTRPLMREAGSLERLDRERRARYAAAAHRIVQNAGSESEALTALLEAALAGGGFRGARFGLVGDPVAHSLSPAIHRFLYRRFGLDAAYCPLHVPADRPERIRSLAEGLGLRGFNVTMPHKLAVLPQLDALLDSARDAGAVNTVLVRDGLFIGANTDGAGFSRAIEPFGGFRERSVALLGAGGAARAIAFRAAEEGARRIAILARSEARAAALADAINRRFPGAATAGTLEAPDRAAPGAELLVNATPLGMENHPGFPSLAFLGRMPELRLVCDIVYDPPETPLLAEAARLGLPAQNGLPMLVGQAVSAFELWTGLPVGAADVSALSAHLAAHRSHAHV